ncbi:hypothetical protein OG994_23395 [Micromonospora globbae]|uniref:Uncharacterized protein n=1 Tax=Micromonospora globbae TaxID=1894969 RepID=A0ABZ1S246_9ACTN|nr:hypothetical protein [Micromonospora globbae]
MGGWVNVDRVAVIVAIIAVIVSVASVVYGRRQANIAQEAKQEARRSADAAEQQVKIAEAAKDEARRAADAASDVARMEARRDHLAGAIRDVELLEVESRQHPTLPHRNLFAVFKNSGHRVYRYSIQVEYNTNSHSPVGTGRIDAGETVAVYLLRDGVPYGGIVAWFDGECPCDQPDGDQGHWRKFWRAPAPVVPQDEPPNVH